VHTVLFPAQYELLPIESSSCTLYSLGINKDGFILLLPKKDMAGTWTIHVVRVGEKDTMNWKGKFEEERVSVRVPRGATVRELLEAINGTKINMGSGPVDLRDLFPFVPSHMDLHRRGEESFLLEELSPKGTSAPEKETAKRSVPNCKWVAPQASPEQTLAEAGLCDGAELGIVGCCWEG